MYLPHVSPAEAPVKSLSLFRMYTFSILLSHVPHRDAKTTQGRRPCVVYTLLVLFLLIAISPAIPVAAFALGGGIEIALTKIFVCPFRVFISNTYHSKRGKEEKKKGEGDTDRQATTSDCVTCYIIPSDLREPLFLFYGLFRPYHHFCKIGLCVCVWFSSSLLLPNLLRTTDGCLYNVWRVIQSRPSSFFFSYPCFLGWRWRFDVFFFIRSWTLRRDQISDRLDARIL